WASIPFLETLVAPASALRHDVFDLSGAAERQADVAVDAVFPDAAPGATAAIYQEGNGVLGNEVPAELDADLRAKGVVPVHISGVSPTPFPATDAAFVSLSTASAKSWLQDARNAGFAPARGIMAMSPMGDSSLLPL